ncbi:hypothetical protein GWC77_11470 [Paraburkholderia sp. NMBU_R16]|nr:hypothetical protein [Paraburkholderia sp. NMBU_R16]NRO96548.1 hypothetical protein [Paraburkholderia sp. NMBU_R16]
MSENVAEFVGKTRADGPIVEAETKMALLIGSLDEAALAEWFRQRLVE